MKDDLVVVFGGSGFIGKQVVRALAKRGKRVRVAMRRPHLGHELRVMGDVGQIQLVQANVRFPESVAAALEGATAVVNLVAVMHENGRQTFNALHVEAARTVAEEAAKKGVTRYLHMSALGAGPRGARYAKTKFAGEQAVREAVRDAVIMRPSVVFGPGDDFFNRFAAMAQFASATPLGMMPLIGGGKTKLQPVFVGDVADAICAALDREDAQGRTFELGGPRIYTWKEILSYTMEEADREVPFLYLPFVIAQPAGLIANWIFKLLPWDPPLTGDQVTMLTRDNVVGSEAGVGTLADLGVTSLESVEAIVPSYLWRFRPYGQFQTRQNPT
ncbi:complex I NDUFA9 subunit family protein [Terricaulis sp.]|uniref:complex I NDUFA9 subunit family protein n=1 Tax=Terricaulis sp. TaxID=2768686 RepID=UPI003782E86B